MSRATLRRYFRHGLFPQLLVFEAVARLRSVTRAAEELHLAQPTVSMQLKKLSHALELRLFEPDGRGLKITPAGQALLEVCGELIGLFQRADARLAPFRRQDKDGLGLAAPPEARDVAARLLAEFCARHPGVQAILRDVMLFEGRIDGAYNAPDAPDVDNQGEHEPWKSRASTTRR
jgi:DNA-binding transcriptional LysR family regulator